MPQLEGLEWPFTEGKTLKVKIEAYFSNKASDLDNVCKPTLDILQKAFDFNDKYVYEMELFKNVVKKGEEKLIVEISELEGDY